MDITYIPIAKGFLYLVAVIDWRSPKVPAHRLSNTPEADFCVEAAREAIARYGAPKVFNTDQGWLFTSEAFTTSALKARDVAISMDGKGRWRDNAYVECLWRSLKQEEVLLVCLRDGGRGPQGHHRLPALLQRRTPALRA